MTRALPRDRALPRLGLALDGDAMAEVFAAALRGRRVRRCEVDRVKYRPGRGATLGYRLVLRDERTGRDTEQRAGARLCTAGESAQRLERAAVRAALPAATGAAWLHLPALDMLVHWAPNDAKLDALAWLDGPAALPREAIEPVAAALGAAGGAQVRDATLVQYVPEQRACARVQVALPRPGAEPALETLYVKADVERRGGRTHAVMQALREGAAQAGGRLHTPVAVHWDAARGLQWQRALAGRPLLDADPAVGAALSARVGDALAALHATPVAAAPAVAAEALRRQPRATAQWLAAVEPAWAARLAGLAQRLEAGGDGLAHEPPATLHGDLHARNILVAGDRLAFIDLDGVRHGPAAMELGAWVADALYRAVLDGSAPAAAAGACRAFLDAYAGAAGRRTDARTLAWATAHSLLCTRAYRGVANLKPGRYESVPALLALAEAIAGAGAIDAAWGVLERVAA